MRSGDVRAWVHLLVSAAAALLLPHAHAEVGGAQHGCGAAALHELLDPRLRCLTDTLLRSNGATDDELVASALDELRSIGKGAAPAADALTPLLSHRSPLYSDRDKQLVVRLRAYVLLTLAYIGFPDAAIPSLIDTLAHLDERIAPLEVGAAARAVRHLPESGCEFAPYLIPALALRLSEEEFSLERYEPVFPPFEATTIQLEVVRTLGHVCSRQERSVVEALERLADYRGGTLDKRVIQEARTALARMGRSR